MCLCFSAKFTGPWLPPTSIEREVMRNRVFRPQIHTYVSSIWGTEEIYQSLHRREVCQFLVLSCWRRPPGSLHCLPTLGCLRGHIYSPKWDPRKGIILEFRFKDSTLMSGRTPIVPRLGGSRLTCSVKFWYLQIVMSSSLRPNLVREMLSFNCTLFQGRRRNTELISLPLW